MMYKAKKIRRYCLKSVSYLFLKVAIAYNILCYIIVLKRQIGNLHWNLQIRQQIILITMLKC